MKENGLALVISFIALTIAILSVNLIFSPLVKNWIIDDAYNTIKENDDHIRNICLANGYVKEEDTIFTGSREIPVENEIEFPSQEPERMIPINKFEYNIVYDNEI